MRLAPRQIDAIKHEAVVYRAHAEQWMFGLQVDFSETIENFNLCEHFDHRVVDAQIDLGLQCSFGALLIYELLRQHGVRH